MDPRVKAPLASLSKQLQLSRQLYEGLLWLSPAAEEAAAVRKQIDDLRPKVQGDVLAAVNALGQKLRDIMGVRTRRPVPGTPAPSLGDMKTRMLTLLTVLQETDDAPTSQATAAIAELTQGLSPLKQRWQSFQEADIPALNKKLKEAGLPELKGADY
jgi:hypothetical protein